MTLDDWQSLQNIGCIPWGAAYDQTARAQDVADYYCPEFGLNLGAAWDLEAVDVPFVEDNPWPAPIFPATGEVESSPVEAVEIETGTVEASGDYAYAFPPIIVDVFAPEAEPVPVLSSPVPGEGLPSVSPATSLELAPLQIELDVFANPLYEEKSMMEEYPLQIGPQIVGGVVGALASEAIADLKQYFNGPAPREITGSELMTAGTTAVTARNRCMPGFHVNAKGTACVRNRHMNPLNPKALARSVRRLAKFQEFATKTERVIQASFRKAGVRAPKQGRCNTCKKSRCSCR